MRYPRLVVTIALLIVTALPLLAVTSFVETINCTNGFGGAFTVTTVDQWGCVMHCHGVDCSGSSFSFSGPAKERGSDLGLSYNYYYTGMVDGQQWYANVQLGASGSVARVWGMRYDGSYYEIVPE